MESTEEKTYEIGTLDTHKLGLEGLQKIAAGDGSGVVYFRSGHNHPWHISNSFFFDKDVQKNRQPKTITNDCEHTERNMKWWSDYKPASYAMPEMLACDVNLED